MTKKKTTKKKSTRKKTTKKKTTTKKASSANDETKKLKEEKEKLEKENEQLKTKADIYNDMEDENLEGDNMIDFNKLNNDWDNDEEYEEEQSEHNIDLSTVDVFEYGIKLRNDRGLYPEWTIKKNGAVTATKRSSYSFDELQKEYGGGHYEIFLKDGNTKRYIKKQTTDVGEAPVKEKIESDNNNQQMNQQNSHQSLLDALTLMSQFQSSASRDNAETSKAKVEAQALQNQMLMQSMQQMQTQNTESMKMMMKMIQTSQDNTAKMIEGMARSIKDSSNKGNDGFSMRDILEMQESSKARAAKEMKQYMDMAKEMVEERMSYVNESKTDDTPKSSIDKLIDNVAPAITKLLMNPPKPVGQNPQTTNPPSPVQPNNQVMSQYRNTESKPRDITSKDANNTNRLGPPRIIGKSSLDNDFIETNSIKTPKPPTLKEKILDTVLPIVTEDLVNSNKAKDSAEKSVNVVEAKGFTKNEILDNFKLKDIIEIADRYSLPTEAYPWLKDYYAEIENRCKITEKNPLPRKDGPGPTLEASAESL